MQIRSRFNEEIKGRENLERMILHNDAAVKVMSVELQNAISAISIEKLESTNEKTLKICDAVVDKYAALETRINSIGKYAMNNEKRVSKLEDAESKLSEGMTWLIDRMFMLFEL
jgi:NAD-specific glutamate dehydrogenase